MPDKIWTFSNPCCPPPPLATNGPLLFQSRLSTVSPSLGHGPEQEFTHGGEVLRATVLASVLAVQQHVLDAVTRPLHKLQHVEGLAGEKLAVVCGLPQSRHEVIEVVLLHAQQPGHPENVVPPYLGFLEAVVVAQRDGWEVHDRTVHLIQDGDVRVLVVLNHTVGHLVEEDGQGGAEGGGPEQPAQSHPAGQEDVAQAVEGAVGPKHCDIGGRPWGFLFWGTHDSDREGFRDERCQGWMLSCRSEWRCEPAPWSLLGGGRLDETGLSFLFLPQGGEGPGHPELGSSKRLLYQPILAEILEGTLDSEDRVTFGKQDPAILLQGGGGGGGGGPATPEHDGEAGIKLTHTDAFLK